MVCYSNNPYSIFRNLSYYSEPTWTSKAISFPSQLISKLSSTPAFILPGLSAPGFVLQSEGLVSHCKQKWLSLQFSQAGERIMFLHGSVAVMPHVETMG